MVVKLDSNTLQQMISYINNVKMTVCQRDMMHRVIIESILVGELDTERFFQNRTNETTNVPDFVEDVKQQGSQGWISANTLYSRYKQWCEEAMSRPLAMAAFAQTLKGYGIPFKRASDANYYLLE